MIKGVIINLAMTDLGHDLTNTETMNYAMERCECICSLQSSENMSRLYLPYGRKDFALSANIRPS